MREASKTSLNLVALVQHHHRNGTTVEGEHELTLDATEVDRLRGGLHHQDDIEIRSDRVRLGTHGVR